jgi:hypothetical protein
VTTERDIKQDERIDAAYRIFRAMCAEYPDRMLTLVDADGNTLARSDWSDFEPSGSERDQLGGDQLGAVTV